MAKLEGILSMAMDGNTHAIQFCGVGITAIGAACSQVHREHRVANVSHSHNLHVDCFFDGTGRVERGKVERGIEVPFVAHRCGDGSHPVKHRHA